MLSEINCISFKIVHASFNACDQCKITNKKKDLNVQIQFWNLNDDKSLKITILMAKISLIYAWHFRITSNNFKCINKHFVHSYIFLLWKKQNLILFLQVKVLNKLFPQILLVKDKCHEHDAQNNKTRYNIKQRY